MSPQDLLSCGDILPYWNGIISRGGHARGWELSQGPLRLWWQILLQLAQLGMWVLLVGL